MIGVEFAKLVAAEAVHAEWSTGLLNRAKKLYLSTAIVALMAITAMGVYGFLAKGHLEAAAPIAPVELQIAQKEARQGQLREELDRLTTQQNQLNSSVDAMISNSQSARDARAGLRARAQASGERAATQTRIDTINGEMNTITQELVPLKMKVAEVNTKLGPLQYVADLFGWEDPEAAVRLIILLLMFAFDPLAIVLMIVGTNIWSRWSRGPKGPPAPAAPSPEPEPETEEPETEAAEPISEPIIASQPTPAPVSISPVQNIDRSEEGWAFEPDHRPISVTEVLRDLELRPHEPETPPPPPVGEDLGEDDYSALLSGDMPVFVPTPHPGSWGYVSEAPLFSRSADEVEEIEIEIPAEVEPTGSLLPELEELLQKKTEKSDAEVLVELVEQNPELAEEVEEILEDNPDLLDEVVKVTETPSRGWLDGAEVAPVIVNNDPPESQA
jgi:hypothetical protein